MNVNNQRARIRGSAGAASSTAAALLAACLVAALLAGPAAAAEAVLEGGFEAGSFGAGWVHGASSTGGVENASWADHAVVPDMPFTGSYSALLGYKYTSVRKNCYGYMYQEVAVPATASSAAFSFSYRMQGYDGRGNDPFLVTVRDLSGNILATVTDYAFSDGTSHYKDTGWVGVAYDLSAFAGQTVRLDFRQHNLADNRYETWVFVDDVSATYRMNVDLAVDGNGDDVFGNPGTGSGGISVSSGVAGGTVTYLLDIENEGLDIDSYTVSASPPAGWAVVIRYAGTDYTLPWASPAVNPGATITVEVILTIPGGEPAGSYTTIVDAVSNSDVTRFDSVTLGTNITVIPYIADLVIDGDGAGVIDASGGGGTSAGSVYPGGSIDYTVQVFNAGGQQDAFTISFDAVPGISAVVIDGGTTYTAPFTTGTMDPGDSLSYILRVTASPAYLGGDYLAHVYAQSAGDPSAADGVTAVTTVIAPVLDLVIDGNGNGLYGPTGSGLGGSSTQFGQRETVVHFAITVQNEGGVADAYTFSWDRPSGNWSAVINDGTTDHTMPWTSPSFAPGESRDYVLAVSIPKNAAFNTWFSILDAVSINDDRIVESVAAVITVNDKTGVDLVIDGDGDNVYGAAGTGAGGFSSLSAAPGDTVTFSILLENEGGTNSFDIEWNTPAGWSVLLDGQASPVAGVPEGTYTLQVIIPLTAPAGTFDIIVDGFKSSDHFYVDSVTGQLIVTPTRLVDAVIDGDGDDVFGTAGLGDGGSSSRSALGGQTVPFSVELQNQGAFDESYTVTWSGPAGWTGTFSGSAQPFTTAVIPAGTSLTYAFAATVPIAEAPGDFDYTIDIVSNDDPLNTESVTARVTVYPPTSLDLLKSVDLAAARPGDIVTYTLVYSNPSLEDLVEIELVDPLPLELELVHDAYGAGSDIAWTRGGTTVFLTADPADADEALFDAGTGVLQVIFSRQSPYTLSPGETGFLQYMVRVR